MSKEGFAISQTLKDHLRITPEQQSLLDAVSRNCVNKIIQVERDALEVRNDESGSYYYLPACKAELAGILNDVRTALSYKFEPEGVDIIISLIRADRWFSDAQEDREFGFSIDSIGDLYLNYGDLSTKITDARLTSKANSGLAPGLINRVEHLIDSP